MIEVTNLVKDYGCIRAVDGVTFNVKPGDILGFLGPNGAGKSTTMKILTGFLPATSGSATIGGLDVAEDAVAAREQFGYLPESGPLYPEMTAGEFLRFAAALRRLSPAAKQAALDRVIAACHLERVLHQTIETLSKGYRRRVGLAQAILHDPKYLIMDEPTDGLDPNQKREVRNLIASMGNDKAVILSTHILEEVDAMCNRVIVLTDGKIVADEPIEALRTRAGSLEEVFYQLTNPKAA